MAEEIKVRFTAVERVLDTDDKRMVITCVMGGEDLCDDGLALKADGQRVHGGGDSVPLLLSHGFDIRGRFPLGSVRNLRVETIDGKKFNVGDKHYYSPGEAVKHLQSDLVTMPAVVFDMRKQGHFKAVSQGFRVLKGIAREDGGMDATEWELMELSDCPVGMDPVALDRFIRETKLTDSQRDWLVGRECRDCGQCHKTPTQQVAVQPSSRSVIQLLGELSDKKEG